MQSLQEIELALTKVCPVCGSPPDTVCNYKTWEYALPHPVVHSARVSQT
jgi:hypothetical protein